MRTTTTGRWYRRYRALGVALGITFSSVSAHAQTWTVEDLGPAMAVWANNAPSVTPIGDVAWTRMDSVDGLPVLRARAHVDGVVDLHAISAPAGFQLSFAHDITDARRVVGYFATDQRELERNARLWFRNAGVWSAINLHEATSGEPQQTTAYGAANYGDNGTLVVGMRRNYVSNAVLPAPVAWSVEEGSAQEIPLGFNTTSSKAHGIAQTIAVLGNSAIACGSVGEVGAGYNHAACWDIADPGSPFYPSFLSGRTVNGQSWTHLTSSWERVRAVQVSSTQTHFIAGGNVVFLDPSNNMHAMAVVQNLTTGEVHYPFEQIVEDEPAMHTSLFGDITQYPVQNFAGNITDFGVHITGMISTIANPLDLTPFAPSNGMETSLMRAVRAAYLPGQSHSAPVAFADMNGLGNAELVEDALDASVSTPPLQHVIGIAPDGRWQVVFANGSLLRMQKGEEQDLRVVVYERDLQIRTSRHQVGAYQTGGTPASTLNYHWVVFENMHTAPDRVFLVSSDVPGGEPLDQAANDPTTTCTMPMGLDASQVHELTIAASQENTFSTTSVSAPSLTGGDRYVRVFYEVGGVCHVSEVIVAEPATVNQFLEPAHGTNPAQDEGRDFAMCFAGRHGQGGWDFDTDRNTSIEACGNCTNTCVRPNMDSTCNGGSCEFGACDSGWVDLNENTDDGCECEITNGGVDNPELTGPFYDTNCDGIDGTLSNSILVAPTGSDSASCGTSFTTPCQTIDYALDRAVSTGRRDVLIAQGTYTELVTLRNGKNLYGGYIPGSNGWARSVSNATTIIGTVASGQGLAVYGSGLTQTTHLNQVTVTAPSATEAGRSSIGVLCSNCSGLRISYAGIHAGQGNNGTGGVNGNHGSSGSGGSPDGVGGGKTRSGGAGGTRTCGHSGDAPRGGNGGQGGDWHGTNCDRRRGANGGAGGSWTPASGGGGGGGTWNKGWTCVIGGSARNGGDGTQGTGNGGIGANGAAGGTYSLSGMLLNAATAAYGVHGRHGSAGGGGGGGSGNLAQTGGGGGGGGAGGCGGYRGTPGQGGGSSIAVLLSNSANATVLHSQLTTAQAGNGGRGGTGGNGQAGGSRGDRREGSSAGWGGYGGKGRDGGRGGHGGGGRGGDSVCIVTMSSAAHPASGRTGTSCANNGSAGSGGPSSGNAGVAGDSGMTVAR